MKIKIFSTFLMLVALMTGCKKEEVLSKTELLCQKSWMLTASRSQTNGGAWRSEFATARACEKDNTFTFTTSGSYIWDEGATKCSSADPQIIDTATWKFTTNETKISFGSPNSSNSDVLDIVKLDANTFMLRGETTSGTNVYVDEITFGR